MGAFGSGNSLDKFLFVLGDEVTAVILREGAVGEEDVGGGYYENMGGHGRRTWEEDMAS